MSNALKKLGESGGGQADTVLFVIVKRVGSLKWDGSGRVIFVYFQKMAFDR